MIFQRKGALLSATSLALLLGAAQGGAQAAEQSSPTSSQTVETVVVTAEHRSEDNQKVPIAITAIDGASLDSQSIIGFKELSFKVPSLRFGAGVTGGENVITLRGLGSQNTTPGGDTPVALSVDGVTLQRSTVIDPEFYDIQRIEVLRGPQGTLYGRNSVGGSINIITNKPEDQLDAGADVMVGDYAANTWRGFVTGPLVKNGDFEVDGRLTAVYAKHDPYATNLSQVPGATHNQDGEDYKMVRGQLLFDLSSKVNVLLSGSISEGKDPVATNVAWWEVPARFMVDQGSGDYTIPPGSRCDFSTRAKFDPRKFCHDFAENAKNRVALFSGTLNWDLGFAQLTSIFGYETSKVNQTSDGDGSNLPIAFGSAWQLNQRQISEEVRLASTDDSSPYKWIVGFMYFWSNNYENFAYEDSGFNDLCGAFCFPMGADMFNFYSHGINKTRAWAPFGQVDFDLAKTSVGIPLTITAGLRYSNDEKYGFNYIDYQLPIYCGGSCLPLVNLPFSRTWSQWTGRFGLKYQFNDNVQGYATVSRGYLSGGDIIGLAKIYNPEHVWSYEVGLKTNLLNDRLQLNAAAYRENIYNMQVFIQSSIDSGIDNAARAQVNGLELEAVAVPVDNLRLNATVTLTDSKYQSYVSRDTRYSQFTSPCYDPINNPDALCDFSGNKLNQTPPYTVNIGAEYSILTDMGTFTPRADIFFSGKVYFTPPNNPLASQGAYHQTNLHLMWTSPNEHWNVDAFVNNLENKDVISNDGLQSLTLGQQFAEPDNYAYYPPRTFGVRVGVHM